MSPLSRQRKHASCWTSSSLAELPRINWNCVSAYGHGLFRRQLHTTRMLRWTSGRSHWSTVCRQTLRAERTWIRQFPRSLSGAVQPQAIRGARAQVTRRWTRGLEHSGHQNQAKGDEVQGYCSRPSGRIGADTEGRRTEEESGNVKPPPAKRITQGAE